MTVILTACPSPIKLYKAESLHISKNMVYIASLRIFLIKNFDIDIATYMTSETCKQGVWIKIYTKLKSCTAT